MIYERDKEKQALLDALDEEGHLSQSAFKSYVKNMFHNSVNVFSYMTQEEVTFLQSSWPEEYLLNVENDEKTTHWAQSQILCKLPTRREQIRIHCARQRIYPTAAYAQYNAGGDGCQGRRQGRRSSERRAAARRPLTSGPGGVIRACVRQNRWTAVRESGSSPAAVPSTFS